MSTPDTGERVVADRYVLRASLGRGGMGQVWRADDLLLRRPVAVKEVQILAQVPDEERATARARVLKEARAAARSNHPGSVAVYDVVEQHDGVFIVMELVDAPNLEQVVATEGPLSPAQAAEVGLRLLDALEAAHASGVVHRDVKPANVMVTPGGAVKLADFGIAAVTDDIDLTVTGLVRGSPAYMAPEQATGGPTTAATDLWSLGATLYFAVEGVPPWQRSGAIPTLTAIVNDDPRPPQRAGLLTATILALLAKDPAQRPVAAAIAPRLGAAAGGAAAVAAGAEATAETATVATAGAAGAGPRAVAGRRGGGWHVPAIIGVVVIAAAVLALALWSAGRHGDDVDGDDVETAVVDSAATVPTTVAPTTAASPPTAADTGSATGADERETDERERDERERDERERDDGDEGDEAAERGNRGSPVGGDAPTGWTTHDDGRTGYSIDHPADWEVVRRNRTQTDLRDPETGSYLRVDWVSPPSADDPMDAWEAYEPAFADRNPGYRRIRMEPTTFQGFDAAEWEYVYGSGTHAVNLGFIVSDEYGFALNFVAPESAWDDQQDTFDRIKASFEAP